MNWSALVKFLVGFSLAIALLFFAGVSATRYLITRLTAPPPRPSFPNDDPNFTLSPSPAQPQATAAASPAAAPVAATPSPSPTSSASPSASLAATPSPSADEPGAYEARVTQSIGLVVRQEPSRSAPQAGGVSYNQSIVVLETSADGEWLRVRVGDSGLEGWVKSGNTEPIN
jgi:Bacterial SH3 domain